MPFRFAAALHLPLFWDLQCRPRELMQCTCLFSGFCNAILANSCSALALSPAFTLSFLLPVTVLLPYHRLPHCNPAPQLQCSCLFSGFRTVFPASCDSALALSPASVLQSRSAAAVHLLVFWLPHCLSGFLRQCTCPISSFRTAIPLRGCSALAPSSASALQSSSAVAVHLPLLRLPHCNPAPHLQCS